MEERELLALARMSDPETGAMLAETLGRQVGIAKRLVAEKPDHALVALRQMIGTGAEPAE